MKNQQLLRNDRGAAIIEMAFALPAFIVMVWGLIQLGLIYRANSGIQHALGQGARYATLYPTPTDDNILGQMRAAVYGIGPGEFTPIVTDVPAQGYKDLKVTYEQDTDFLFFPGPRINVTKSKRVWVASDGSSGGEGTDDGTGGETGGGTGGDTGGGTGGDTGGGTGGDTGGGTGGDTGGNTVCKKKNGKPC